MGRNWKTLADTTSADTHHTDNGQVSVGAGALARRDVLRGLGLATVLPASLAAAPAPAAAGRGHAEREPRRWTSIFMDLDPVESFRQVMRLQRSLYDEDDILHWYHFIMFAVLPDAPTTPVVRWEGIEFSRHERIGENRFRLHGHNLSYPRDLQTCRFIDTVHNPVTGRDLPISPMRLVEDPGLIRSPEGTVTLDNVGTPPRMDYRTLRREGGLVKVDSIRVPPATWPAPFIEAGYEGARADLFDDPRHLWLPTEVSGAYVFPWPEWMQMGDTPGHMFGVWSGHKLRSVDELPEEFLNRAQREDPGLLEVDREPFAREVTA